MAVFLEGGFMKSILFAFIFNGFTCFVIAWQPPAFSLEDSHTGLRISETKAALCRSFIGSFKWKNTIIPVYCVYLEFGVGSKCHNKSLVCLNFILIDLPFHLRIFMTQKQRTN